jgi:hypothetical protein
MTHTLEGREAPQAAVKGAIRSSSGAPEAVHLRRVRTNGDRPSGHETGPTPGGPLHRFYPGLDLLQAMQADSYSATTAALLHHTPRLDPGAPLVLDSTAVR